jgi:hypothetical protein
VRAAYLAAACWPEVIHAICDDYRASAFIYAGQDENDQRTGRVLAMPGLAAWQDPGATPLPFDPPPDLVVLGIRPAQRSCRACTSCPRSNRPRSPPGSGPRRQLMSVRCRWPIVLSTSIQ